MPCSLTLALMKAYSPLRLRKGVILVLCLLAAIGHILLAPQVDVRPHRGSVATNAQAQHLHVMHNIYVQL